MNIAKKLFVVIYLLQSCKFSSASQFLKEWYSSGLYKKVHNDAEEPQFAEPMQNLTVAVGREAVFTCVVDRLGEYKVAWVKADTKAILSIHMQVITHNPRISISHNLQNSWNIHIKKVKEGDRGVYMCQLNTEPMKHQVGHLEVVVPPDIIESETSSDTMVAEGESTRLTCMARGYPPPTIRWFREDKASISMKNSLGLKEKVGEFKGKVLPLMKITRSDMGPYLCIASNGVPPAVSKRIFVKVYFSPLVRIPIQTLVVPIGSAATLECIVETSPKSVNYWSKLKEDKRLNILANSNEHETEEKYVSYYVVHVTLTLKEFDQKSAGVYVCTAKNALGEANGTIHVYASKETRQNSDISLDDSKNLKDFVMSPSIFKMQSPSEALLGKTWSSVHKQTPSISIAAYVVTLLAPVFLLQ